MALLWWAPSIVLFAVGPAGSWARFRLVLAWADVLRGTGRIEAARRLYAVEAERCEARRREIVEAFDAWTAERRAVDDHTGYTAAGEAWDAADRAAADLMRAVLATAPTTLAGLAAKERWATESGMPDHAAAGWLRQVAEDAVTLAERGGVGT